MMSDFHFLRPWELLALLPLAGLLWLMRRQQDVTQRWHGIVAPHLLPFLLTGRPAGRRLGPWMLLAAGWALAVLAIAGPTWEREPTPFADDTAALALVVKVSASMQTEDVTPSRLGRATQKIHDLLALRRGAKTALIAYSGSAHRVLPATSDGGIIDLFAQALDPKVMPSEGDAAADALRLADAALDGGGSILWLTDGVAPEQAAPLAAWRGKSRTPVRLLAPLLPGAELDALRAAAAPARVSFVRLSADDSDVTEAARAAKFAPVTIAETSERWRESGYWLTPVLACLLLPFFRRGWMAPNAAQK